MSSSILFPTNEYTTSSKSSQQIQRLMLNEQSCLLDNLLYILNKGHPLQQPYAFRNFHYYPNELLDIVCSRLSKQDYENQIIITQSLKTLMRKKKSELYQKKMKKKEGNLLPNKEEFQQNKNFLDKDDKNLLLYPEQFDLIFNSTLQALSNWASINNQHFIQVLEVAVEMRPWADSKQKQLPNSISPLTNISTTSSNSRQSLLKILEETILNLGKPSQPIISKIISGRLIPIFIKYTGHVIRGQMIDIIKRIISDTQFEAKKIWLEDILPKLLERLKLEHIELHLQQKIYETIYDDNEEIGCMALNVVLKNVNKFSIQEQGSRIVKLFIDSLTSKNQRIVIMVTSIMGQIYQKLQSIILKNEANCLKFWKSLIQVAESKNEKIINNFIINLPGILLLSKKFHRVDAVCEIYAQLFYNPDADIQILAAYFHQIVKMFPKKHKLLKQTIYTMLGQAFQSQKNQKNGVFQPSDETCKILDYFFMSLHQSKQAFFEDCELQKVELLIQLDKNQQGNEEKQISNEARHRLKYFESTFNDYFLKYLTLCLNRKNGNHIFNLYETIQKCYEHFSPSFIQYSLLPKLYQSIRSKTAFLERAMKILVILLTKQINLINNYASKINVQLSKSSKSYEREAAMLFFYYSSELFSIETFQEFKMGEKYLQFSNEKTLKNKLLFIQYLPEVIYYFTREQKIEFNIILNKMKKQYQVGAPLSNIGVSFVQIHNLLSQLDFCENQQKKAERIRKSKKLRQKEKSRGNFWNNSSHTVNSKKTLAGNRRGTDLTLKDIRKEDVLKKRVDTKSRTKILVKQIPKKKTPIVGNRILNINKKN